MGTVEFELDVTRAFRGNQANRPDEEVIQDAILNAVEKGVNVARDNARVDTGYMRDSVDYELDGNTLRFKCEVDYASYNEDGTYKMSAQPFMGPGMDAIVNSLNSDLGLVEEPEEEISDE